VYTPHIKQIHIFGDPMAEAAHLQRERHKPTVRKADETPPVAVKPQGIVGLQRYVGNQGVQRLLAQGLVQMKPDIQRCSACKGTDEETL